MGFSTEGKSCKIQQQLYGFLLFYCPDIDIKPLVIQGKQNAILYWSEIRATCEILEGTP